jgi:outer membrane protein TolC
MPSFRFLCPARGMHQRAASSMPAVRTRRDKPGGSPVPAGRLSPFSVPDSVARWCVAGMVAAALFGSAGRLSAAPPAEKAEDAPRPKRVAPELPPPPASLLDAKAELIDLASALQLAGVKNAEILLARERVVEAVALRQLAAAQILPSLNAGTNFDSHTGPLQRSTGIIQKENRGALYVGLGANAVGAGTVNIPGVVWDGNVSEVIYGRLIARQVVREREFGSVAVRNDVLLRVADGYMELLRAEGRRAIALQTREEARQVARITATFAVFGQGREADANRAATELETRDADVLNAEGEVLTTSARLAQLLDLDPSPRLQATDGWVVPAPIVPDPIPLPELIAIALVQRPELGERRAAIQETLLALDAAKVLPFSPTIIVGYSAGTFGGGSNIASDGTFGRQARFDSFAPRTDFDAVAYWTARNLGVGNLALVRLAQSNVRANNFREIEVLDRVRAEVATAYARTHARFAQIETGERAVQTGAKAFQEDLVRTKNQAGLPIEVLDSLRLLGRSRYAYLDAIVDYNRAQFELYAALGQPPAKYLARPVPADLVPPPALPSPAPAAK